MIRAPAPAPPTGPSLIARLQLDIHTQPDDITCGPTCLHAVYRYYNDDLPLDQVISEVTGLAEGGTLAVMIACHALTRGYQATIYTYNLHVFDPTWFTDGGASVDLAAKLREQATIKKSKRLRTATAAYLEFIELGGVLRFEELSRDLIRRYLKRNTPILTGLSATYLYRCQREVDSGPRKMAYDDVRGEPTGHFVVLCGYDAESKRVLVADPLWPNPVSEVQLYEVPIDRLVNSILLGIVTYDANLLVLQPEAQPEE